MVIYTKAFKNWETDLWQHLFSNSKRKPFSFRWAHELKEEMEIEEDERKRGKRADNCICIGERERKREWREGGRLIEASPANS